MNTVLPRFALHFLAICFLAWNLFLPDGATAASNTITSGTYTGIYGNDGSPTAPTTDTATSSNSLILGDGSSGPTISDTSPMTITGGQAPGGSNGSANSNALTISGGTSLGGSGTISLFGGRVHTGSGTASGNTVTITGFTQSNNSVVVYGGRSGGTGDVLTNQVNIDSGINNFMSIYGGYANSGNVTGNTVDIAGGGQIETVVGGYTYSGNAGGNSAGNIINITGGNANILYGLIGGNSNSGSASYNEVHIGSGYTGTVGTGSTFDLAGGWVNSGSGNAEQNIVEINGGTFQNGATVIGGHSTGGSATGNSVTISGGTVGGDIYGGRTTIGSATGNSVTITTTGATYQNIYGGGTNLNTAGDLFTGNTLDLNAGNTVSSVHNMATLNFTSGGNAGVGLLDTTATGAGGNPLVKINTNANAVAFGGVISGTGGIDKTGAGTLTLTGTNTYSGGTTVTTGMLAGNIAANTDLTVASGATYGGQARPEPSMS